MPLIKIDKKHLEIDYSPQRRIQFLQTLYDLENGPLRTYYGSFEPLYNQLRALHPDFPVSGFTDAIATIYALNTDGSKGQALVEMEVMVAFKDNLARESYDNDGDWVIARCPPNDHPKMPSDAGPDHIVAPVILDTLEKIEAHLNL